MAGDGYIAIGGTTTNALMLRASAEYQNAAVLLIVQENNTVDVSTVVTYTFADGKKINGVKSIKIAGGPPYWTLGIFSMDSGQDLVFFTWSNNSVVTIKVINSFKTNFGCMTSIDNSQKNWAQTMFKDCASSTYYAATFSKNNFLLTKLHSF